MRRYSPQDKKKMAYERDWIRRGESDKGTRKSVPRGKRRIQRAYRRGITQQMHELTRTADSDPFDTEDLQCIVQRRRRWYSYGSERLDDYVASRLQVRTMYAGYNLFKTMLERDNTEHIEAVERLLEAWTASTRGESVALARLVAAYLDPEPWLALSFEALREELGQGGWHIERRAAFFDVFLSERPEWRPRLESWIAACEEAPQLR